MELNDKESYVVRNNLIDSVHRGLFKDEQSGYQTIYIQINGRPHDLFYDDEETRDADFDLINRAICKT